LRTVSTIIFIAILATLAFFYVRMLFKRLEPASLRRAAEAATAYRIAMGLKVDVADAERHIRRMTTANIFVVMAIAAAVIVAQIVSTL
jgi:hypothetical protein